MALAAMLAIDKDAVICDLAETYRIYNYRALPVETLAVLVLGLRADSRIKMKMSGYKKEFSERAMLAKAVDLLTLIFRLLTDGTTQNAKDLLIDIMLSDAGGEEQKSGFKTIEEYETARKKFFKG